MKRIISLFILLLVGIQLAAFPIRRYEYHLPEKQVSAISLSLGGSNVTYRGCSAPEYNNPAILAYLNSMKASVSYQMRNSSNENTGLLIENSNKLKRSQFVYANAVAKQGAISIQPLADLSETNTYSDSGKTYTDYSSYTLNSVGFTYAEKRKGASFGLNFKYMFGRLIYKKDDVTSDVIINEDFIDDRVHGFSTDLGFLYKSGNYSSGLVVYDIVSQLYWKKSGNVTLKQRFAFGNQYGNEEGAFISTVTGYVRKSMKQTYHFGIVRNYSILGSSRKNSSVRTGVFSRDFSSQKDIYVTMGSTYSYDKINFEFAMVVNDLNIDTAKYLLTISFGE